MGYKDSRGEFSVQITLHVISKVVEWNIVRFIRHAFGLPDGFLCISPKFLNTCVFPCDTTLLKQSCPWRKQPQSGEAPCEMHLWTPSPLLLVPKHIFRPSSSGDCSTYVAVLVWFFFLWLQFCLTLPLKSSVVFFRASRTRAPCIFPLSVPIAAGKEY